MQVVGFLAVSSLDKGVGLNCITIYLIRKCTLENTGEYYLNCKPQDKQAYY